jgi:hypothetical protein
VTQEGTASTWARWAMLCALVLGVLVMHHTLPAEGDHPSSGHSAPVTAAVESATTAQSDNGHEMPSGEHDLLHLCLAILVGAFALVLTRLWRSTTMDTSRRVHSERGESTPARDPPASDGRQILLTVCVLRV